MSKKLNMTGAEYRKKLNELNNEKRVLEAHIQARATELCKQHPTAPIGMGAVGRELEKLTFIATMDSLSYLYIIDSIEKYLADQHPHKQLKLYK
jgi:hypothetical protein